MRAPAIHPIGPGRVLLTTAGAATPAALMRAPAIHPIGPGRVLLTTAGAAAPAAPMRAPAIHPIGPGRVLLVGGASVLRRPRTCPSSHGRQRHTLSRFAAQR